MKNCYLFWFVVCLVFAGAIRAQQNETHDPTKSPFFNLAYWNALADKKQMSAKERAELIETQRHIFEEHQSGVLIDEKDIVWKVHDTPSGAKGFNQATVSAGPCTNIDFEQGNMSGWVRSTGYNPLFNATGCCPNSNGDQTIMSSGTDPYGGFPCVYPGGGNFSLRLGSTAVGGIADRISQTFFVTAANANFTYRYALVLNDGGHPLNQQPRFTSEIVDTLGNPVPCTFYQASAGTNTFGLTSSTLGAPNNNSPVSYKNWTNVLIDLTPNIGQNVTLRFTVYDCGPSGHFAYAYIDGLCTNFATTVSDTTCPNIPISMCAPVGFSTTTWNGPGVSNNPNQCISVSAAGVYTCTTILIPGCPGPTFTHTLINRPAPVLSFTPVSTGPCSLQYTFNASSSISGASITSYKWSFGDGGTATVLNTSHIYTTPGTYQVKLKAYSSQGCADSVITPITIFPFPNIAFSPPSNCINTIIQFSNNTTISPGSVSGYTWNLGNGVTSNAVNPTNSYTANGNYTITLTAISNQGCASTLTQTLGIFPPPIISFSANPLCDINGTSFTPATSTAVASGSLSTFFWDFGDGGTSTQANPVHIYNGPGTYSVTFTAMTNHSCSATTSNVFSISPSPSVAFSTASVNACTQNFTFTNNSAASTPITYTWNFGGSNTSTTSASSLTYTFPGIGNYTVRLVGMSNSGCTDTAFQAISIFPYPAVTISVPASCENAIFTVTTAAVSGSVTSYNWNFGDPASGAANTSTLQNPTHFYSVTNNYVITLNIVSNLNCPSTTVVPITVFPNPTSIFNFTTANNCSLPYTYLNNSTVSSIGSSSITSYLWNFGTAGTSTVVSPGTVSFPGSGTYSVSLIATTNHNCSDTASYNISVFPLPQLNFSVNPDCQTASFSFPSSTSIVPSPGPSSINSYTWNFGDNSLSTLLSPPPHTYSASGNYTVSLSATSNMGCISTVAKTQVVYPMPVVNFTTTGNMCFGNSTSFSSTSAINPPSVIYGYSWDFGDGATGSGQSPIHTYSTNGSYPVTFTVSSNNECSTILTKTVTIDPLPVISFSVPGVCLNAASQFSTTFSIPTGTVSSFNWNLGDGFNVSGQNPFHTYTLASTYVATLTATSNKGCVSSATNNVVVHPLPIPNFSAAPVCLGGNINFVNTSTISLGTITSYSWDFSDSGISALTSPSHNYTLHGTYVVTLTAQSNQNCMNSATAPVQVNPYPTSSLTTINSSCIFDQVSFNPNLSIAAGTVPSATINFGDGTITTYTNPLTLTVAHTYTAYNVNGYTLNIIATSNNNCTKTFTNVAIIYPKPFTNYTVSSFCHKSITSFTNLSVIPVGSITSHYWSFLPSALTSTTGNPQIQLPGPGVYSVSLTEFSYPEAGLTCSNTTVKQITINALPTPTFNAGTVCQGLGTSFSNLTPTLGITGWNWDFDNNGTIDNSVKNPTFVYPAAGHYTVMLIAKNNFNCFDTLRKQITVYSNPTALFSVNNVCLGNAVTFSNNSLPGSGSSLSYTWSANFYTFATIQNPSYTFTNSGIYQVELTAVSDLGCINKKNSSVVIYDLPVVNYTVNNPCLNSPATFTNLTSIATGSVVKWRWDFENDGTWDDSTNYHPSKLYPGSGPVICNLQAISNNQCVSVTSKTIVVRALPVADFRKSSSKPVCLNDEVKFTNLSTCSDGSITAYWWDFNNDAVQDNGEMNPTYSFSVTGLIPVKHSVMSQYGCTATKISNMYLNVKAVPFFTSDKQQGCPPLCVVFSNQSSIPSGSISNFAWDFGDATPTFTGIANPSHCFNPGSFAIKLTVTSDSGCVSSLNVPSFINTFPKPNAGFVVDPPQIDEDQPVIDVKSTASGASFLKYYISDGSTYNSSTFTHNFIKLDNKTKPMIVQIVKSSSGCSDTASTLLDIKPAFAIYVPNVFTPNGDGLNDFFQIKGFGITKLSVSIFDRWGKKIFTSNDINQPWDGMTPGGEEPIKEEVYVWKAQATDVFNKIHNLVGHVTVLR